jgi:16S rRNA (cytosine967-C5)-methyltransferase
MLSSNLRAIVASIIHDVFQNQRYADQAIAWHLKKQRNLSSTEQGQVAEWAYELVRQKRLLETAVGVSADSAAVWEKLLGFAINIRQGKLVEGHPLFSHYQAALSQRAARLSITDWLDEQGEKELGERWENTLQALNQAPKQVLRCNTLKITPTALLENLQAQGIKAEILVGDALLLQQAGRLFQTPAFQEGWFEMQDFNSQQVATFLQVKPGMRIIDACAGNGGKTLQLAALSENKGHILALDNDARKLEQLRQRARRAGVNNVESRHIDNNKVIKRLENKADRLLLDVPCSGMGVLRRNPDTRWRLDAAQLARLQHTQADILQAYAKMLKPGGLMVYATCSIFPSENQAQIGRFLEQNSQFSLDEERILDPVETGFDGFYMARLKREAPKTHP